MYSIYVFFVHVFLVPAGGIIPCTVYTKGGVSTRRGHEGTFTQMRVLTKDMSHYVHGQVLACGPTSPAMGDHVTPKHL